jgi:hypothetical protein
MIDPQRRMYDSTMANQRKPGRPVGSGLLGNKARSKRFELRLTAAALERWKAAAQAEALPLSELVEDFVELAVAWQPVAAERGLSLVDFVRETVEAALERER